MMKFKQSWVGLIFCILLVPFSENAIAQEKTITGKVTSLKDQQSLPGVSVNVKGTNNRAITDIEGIYSIKVNSASAVLEFSYIGFIKQEFAIPKSNILNISLSEDMKTLDEIVVVGYGTQKKSDVTGAIASIPRERLQQLPNNNIAQALQGSVPGIQINTNGGGSEGNNVSIQIRGRNSISASNRPLIIWDGIPYTGGLSDINVNDVETIDVLKDASAAAIYGSRGSNGVILITSKQGKKGKVSITYDGSYGTQTLTNKPELLTGPEFYQFKTTRLNTVNILSPDEQAVYDAGKWVDWYDLATQNGTRSQHSLSIKGGAENVSFYIGGTYLDVKGVAVNDQYKRYSLRPTLEIKIKPWLTFNTSSQLSFQNRDQLPVEFSDTRNTGGGANFFNPLTTPYDINGNIRPYAYDDYPQARNPLSNTLVKSLDGTYRIFSNNNIKVGIPFIKGLSYKLNTGIEYENNERKTFYGRDVARGFESNGNAINYNALSRNFTIENILYYQQSFNKHNINFTGLYSSQSEDFDRDQIEGIGFPNDVLTNYQLGSAALLTPSSTNYKQNILSQMARFNYSFDSKYLLTLTIRRDGFSAFGSDTKYGTYPSVALGWNLINEGFMKKVLFINALKLRGSYGLNGNSAVSSYSALATLTGSSWVSGGIVYPGYTPNRLSNNNLGWESTKSLSIGLEFGILKNRIEGTVDYYSSKTSDLLLNRAISSVHGFTSILQNIGKTANKGIEVGITTRNLDLKDFKWNTSINFSANKNKIVDLYGNGKDDLGNQWFIGQPIRVNYGLLYDGIYRSAEEVAASNQPKAQPGWVKVKDANGDNILNTASDRLIIGQLDPKFSWGFTNNFSYKGLSLMVFFQGTTGVTKQNPFEDDNVFSGTKRNTTKKDWWSPTNPNGTHFSNDANANILGVSFYENADFVRLKDISLSYQIPNQLLQKASISNLKIYVTGRNLATITKYAGLDPEFTNQYGIPLQREITLGITLGL
jgi:TonB-linked SusC/RagA family outer membrane protein